MLIIPYIQAFPASYYSPHDYQCSRSFTLDPGRRILVTFDRHNQLNHVVTRPVCGNTNRTVTWHYASQDKVGLLVINTDSSVIRVQRTTYLNVLLNLKKVRSHFVTLSEDDKILCRCHLPPLPPPDEDEEYDSCESECNHSDIDND